MSDNINQKVLVGIDGMHKYKFGDMVHELISKHGLVTMANELEIDKSALSRWKNGEGGLTLAQMERLLTFSDTVLISRKRYRRLVYTIISMSEFLKEAIGW